VRSEVLYSILIEFGVMDHRRLDGIVVTLKWQNTHFSTEKGIENHELGTGFMHIKRISAVKRV
jgi:hypothetical protein